MSDKMTVEEIENQIKELNKKLAEEKERVKLEKIGSNKNYIGSYYKLSPTDYYDVTVGRLFEICGNGCDFLTKEIYFDKDNGIIEMNDLEFRDFDELIFIDETEFDVLFDEIVGQGRKKFKHFMQ